MLVLLAMLSSVTWAQSVQVLSVDQPITVDGRLDEEAWSRAEPVTDFARFIPTEGGPPPGSTEVRFLQDAKNLYVGVRISGADYPIRARISPREDINDDDQVGIYLDTFRDERTGYVFYLNALGIQQDIRIGAAGSSFSWGTVWHSEGRPTEDGYVLEIAFPFRSFKYPPGEEQTWNLLLTRKTPHVGAKYGWPQQTRSPPRRFSEAGRLEGVRPPPSGSGLELIPTITTVQEWSRASRRAPQEWGGVEPLLDTVRPSVDGRYGITPNLAAVATLNPDFSQVEIDVTPIALNQRFAFYFDERRPFFLEGLGHFGNAQSTLYSRSIVEPIYGAKMYGKHDGVSVGVLQSVDRSPTPTVHENGAPGFDAAAVQDRQAADLLAVVRADAWESGHVGFTVADKRLMGTEPGVDARGTFEEVGAEFEAPLGGRWYLGGSQFHSWTDDRAEPVPALWGTDSRLLLSRASGEGTGFSFGVSDRSPGFRRELGFLNQSGITGAGVALDHWLEPNGSRIDYWVPGLQLDANQERNGDYYRSARHSQSILVNGIHNVGASAALRRQSDNGFALDLWNVDGSWQAQLGERVYVGPALQTARVIDYARLVPARFSAASLSTNLRPTVGMQFELTVSGQSLSPEGASTQYAQLERLNWTWQFTRPLGARAIFEHTDGTERDPTLVSNVLLTWLVHPGTAAYLGYGETTDLRDGPVALSRSVFAKASVLLRP